jgi:hypothetical protein
VLFKNEDRIVQEEDIGEVVGGTSWVPQSTWVPVTSGAFLGVACGGLQMLNSQNYP